MSTTDQTRINLRRWGIASTAALVLAGCAASPERGTEVTRFHLEKPIARQTVRIQPAEGMDAKSIEYNSYQGIVAAELTNAGFEVVDAATASLRADLRVSRGLRQVAPKSSGIRIGIGGGSYGRSSGVSGGVSAPVGGRSGGEVFATVLTVQLINVSESASIWEGEAVNTVAAAPSSPVATARMLAAALFADFPGESGKTVKVSDAAP